MFLAVQFPFADIRGFLEGGGSRLARPAWPLAEPGLDFVRSAGLVQPRRRGGVADWAGEELYGDAKRAFRFPDRLDHLQFPLGEATGTLRCAFRRFHSEGTVARLEVGLKVIPVAPISGTPVDLLTLIRSVLTLQVSVRDTNLQPRAVKLIDAGEHLARHFLFATTNHQRRHLAGPPEPWWLTCGNPALVIEHSVDIVPPPHTRRVLEVSAAGASLSHAWIQFGKERCSVWFMARSEGDPDAARRLRIHLIRLHAERECLRAILVHIRQGNRLNLTRNTPTSDAVQSYLRDTVHLLNKPRHMGLEQSAMLEAAHQALGVVFEGETASLTLLRRQVAALVDGYVRRAQNTAAVINNIQGNVMNTNIQMGNVSVTGDFNVVTATNIQNSFNKAANSNVDADLKDKLKAVAVEVAKLAKQLPPDDAERVSKDLEAFTSEAVSKTPRKEWYELSAKGLLEAAKTVAAMAAPITTAVKAVLALLAV
ncbi:hypothetical protein ACFPN2_20950 [Steroidobacter flavus]|uniref:Uncharacterized protein n=1 Tax=Steroidobacter flavus TaxID=1842136 RepID=A0ABV8SVH6_9GAMM